MSADRGVTEGYRSGLEQRLAAYLLHLGIEVKYEDPASVIWYTKPATKSRYTPDFILPNGIIIETKGRFVTADRKKHLLIRQQSPHLDIRFIFSNDRSRISKVSKTTYADWCHKHEFRFARAPTPKQLRDGVPFIPSSWL